MECGRAASENFEALADVIHLKNVIGLLCSPEEILDAYEVADLCGGHPEAAGLNALGIHEALLR